MDAAVWLERFAAALSVEPPSLEEKEALLSLAAVAANASERVAAPVSCWLVAKAGYEPGEALRLARKLAGEGPAAAAATAPAGAPSSTAPAGTPSSTAPAGTPSSTAPAP